MQAIVTYLKNLLQGPPHTLFADLNEPYVVRPKIWTKPFKHAVIENFLPQVAYQDLSSYFDSVLKKGISSEFTRDGFFYRKLYDVNIFTPKPSLTSPVRYFYSVSYFEMLRSIFFPHISNDTILGFHHHKENRNNNYIHTDFVQGYFVDDPLENGINPWYHQCSHSEFTDSKQRQMVKAVAGVYYLNNSEDPSLGGETGIFSQKDFKSLVRKIEPKNNRLLLFEITPTSWHNFMASYSNSRNSIAQWFFTSSVAASDRFRNTTAVPIRLGY